jgi:hypothetical protein
VEIEKNVVAELRVQAVAHDVQGRVRVQGFERGNWLPKVELGWLRGGRGRWGTGGGGATSPWAVSGVGGGRVIGAPMRRRSS